MTGKELEERRKALGLSMDQAARFLGVERTSVWRWEKTDELSPMAAAICEKIAEGEGFRTWLNGTANAKERRAINRRLARNAS